MINPASDGVSVIATTSDVTSATDMVMAKALKNTPVMPLKKASGIKTTTGVSVDPTSGLKISPIDSLIARSLSGINEILVWIASATTIASSMMRPIAEAIPPRVMRLKVKPLNFMAASVTSTVTGIAIMVRKVVRQLRKKRNIINIDRMRPKIIASQTLPTEALTISD